MELLQALADSAAAAENTAEAGVEAALVEAGQAAQQAAALQLQLLDSQARTLP